MALNLKQKTFVQEYLVDLNATQAAIRAGYSPKTAYSQGQRLLKKDEVQEAIQEARARQEKRIKVTADDILREILSVGMRQASDVQDSELKYSNKLKALELAGRHLGMFDKKAADTRDTTENNLMDRLIDSTGEDVDTDDLPEVE